jgi:IS5 family transposase
LLKEGALVDAMIIAVPPLMKNADKARDDQKMHQMEKGQQWFFGMTVISCALL